jgi:hypothetical protein
MSGAREPAPRRHTLNPASDSCRASRACVQRPRRWLINRRARARGLKRLPPQVAACPAPGGNWQAISQRLAAAARVGGQLAVLPRSSGRVGGLPSLPCPACWPARPSPHRPAPARCSLRSWRGAASAAAASFSPAAAAGLEQLQEKEVVLVTLYAPQPERTADRRPWPATAAAHTGAAALRSGQGQHHPEWKRMPFGGPPKQIKAGVVPGAAGPPQAQRQCRAPGCARRRLGPRNPCNCTRGCC